MCLLKIKVKEKVLLNRTQAVFFFDNGSNLTIVSIKITLKNFIATLQPLYCEIYQGG